MGCFNLTCSVSHLPITAGDPIRAFVLARPDEQQEYKFYTTSFFVPLTTGIQGKYDDYGRLEDEKKSAAFDLSLAHYFPQLKGEHGEFLDGSYSEKGALQHYDEKIGFDTMVAFVREDVYQEVMKLRGQPDRESVKEQLTEIKKAYDEEAAMYTRLKDIKGVGDEYANREPSLYSLSSGMRWFELCQLFRGGEGDLLTDALKPYNKKIMEFCKVKPAVDDEMIDLAMEVSELLRFNRALHELCIAWQPTTNMVGQETPFDIQRDFNRAVAKICAKEIKARKEFDEQFEDKPISTPKKKKVSGQKKSPKRG